MDINTLGAAIAVAKSIPGTAAQRAEAAQAAAEAVAESIPQDYSALSEDVQELKSAISGISGLSARVKAALLACFGSVAWKDEFSGTEYIAELEAALDDEGGGGGTVTLEYITASYTDGDVAVGTDISTLSISVTAHYSDGTSEAVTTFTRTTGTIVAGNNTITVTYQDKTAAVIVRGYAPPAWSTGVPLTLGTIEAGDINSTTGEDVESTTRSRTGFIDIEGANLVCSRVVSNKQSTGNNVKIYFYDEDFDFISSKSFNSTTNIVTIASVPTDTKYARFSAPNDNIATEATTPYEFVATATPAVYATTGTITVDSTTIGSDINTTTGEQSSTASTRSSQLIPIYGMTGLSLSKNGEDVTSGYFAFYDKDENYIVCKSAMAVSKLTDGNIPFAEFAYMRIYKLYTPVGTLAVNITA